MVQSLTNVFYRVMNYVTTRPYVRKCDGRCGGTDPHTAHLTALGLRHYTRAGRGPWYRRR